MNKDYSHVARKAYIGKNNREMYFQSSEGKVNYEYKDVFLSKHEIVLDYVIEVSDELYQEIADTCLLEAGKKYATMQNVGIVFVRVCGWLGIKKQNPWKDGRNCSELIYNVILKKMIPWLSYSEDLIEPHQIEAIIEANFQVGEDGIYRLKVISTTN